MRSFVPKLTILVLLLAVGCAGSQRTETIRAALVTADAARDGFVRYDAAAQAAIVADATTPAEATTKLATYRADRDKATGPAGLLTAAYHAIASAALANDDQSITSMRAAVAQLVAAIAPYVGGAR